MNILYEDKDILVCIKEAGVPTQSSRVHSKDMVSIIKSYLFEHNNSQEPYLGLVHRLDQPVEGIMVFAKNPHAAGELGRQVQKGAMDKQYLAVMTGMPPRREGQLIDYIAFDSKTNCAKIVASGHPRAKRAELFYRVIKSSQDLHLGEIRLITGRHHQIRVQMAHAKAPLWGDTKYNEKFKDKKGWFSLALCANRLTFLHPGSGREMKFEMEPSGEIFGQL